MPGSRRTIYIRKLHFSEARSRFLREIEEAFLAGEESVEVIHGIGTYTLRNMVIEESARLGYVRVTDTSLNPGALVLDLDSPDPGWIARHVMRGQGN